MLYVEKFINALMSSNCYLLWDEDSKHCVLIDSASRLALNEIKFIKDNNLYLDYIILTHEHTDHTWGVNELIHQFPLAKVICSEACKKSLPHVGNHYFTFYYDDPNYKYTQVSQVFILSMLQKVKRPLAKLIPTALSIFLTPSLYPFP